MYTYCICIDLLCSPLYVELPCICSPLLDIALLLRQVNIRLLQWCCVL